jgi:DNA repair protein RadD
VEIGKGGLNVELRPYQQEALTVLDAYWDDGGGDPLVAMATATGKSLIIAKLLADIAGRYPPFRALILVHVRELIEQNLTHVLKVWPGAPVGINSAGLGWRNWDAPIVLASIQSVFRQPQRLGRRDLIIVDEAHLVPHAGDGMYRTLIETLRKIEPMMRVCGLTATPYRLDSGRLDQGEGRIFSDVVFEYGIAEGIRDGWLAPLSSKATTASIDVRGIACRGGEFVAGDMEQAADLVVGGTCDEIVARGQDRRSWLLFCSGFAHAQHVRDALRERGTAAEMVTGETPAAERDQIIASFRRGDIRALANVNVLTTGFNMPEVDLIAMLRPTLSTGLYVQMVGRGTRKAQGKRDCLILDFAGNVYRHGPVDRLNIAREGRTAGVKVETVSAKRCSDCGELVDLRDYVCPACGHEFPRPKPQVKHAMHADNTPILGGKRSWMGVDEVCFRHHTKFSDPSATPSLRVDYLSGFLSYQEYICFEHDGYARERAQRWWFALGGEAPAPPTITDALARTDELDPVTGMVVARDGNFWRVERRRVRRPDGTLIEVNSELRCYATSNEPPPDIKINDEIPY